jgi:hypothetical protein
MSMTSLEQVCPTTLRSGVRMLNNTEQYTAQVDSFQIQGNPMHNMPKWRSALEVAQCAKWISRWCWSFETDGLRSSAAPVANGMVLTGNPRRRAG